MNGPSLSIDGRASPWWNVTDAAMSIEVGEHIPAEWEDNFINNLGKHWSFKTELGHAQMTSALGGKRGSAKM